MAMVETTLSISNVMSAFQTSFSKTIVYMSAVALRLLMTLATIDLLWSVLSNLDEQDHLKNLILRCMKYGFFLWVVLNYGILLDYIIDGFYWAGLEAGGNTGTVRGYLSNPNKLIEFGLHVAQDNLRYSSQTAAVLANAMGSATQSAISWHDIIAFLTISGYFVMALQVFLTYLEFYILGGLALLLVPFGVFQRTSHLAEKVFTLVICFGVKLMVIAYILSVLDPLFRDFKAPGAESLTYVPSIPESIQYLSGSLVLCILLWHAPNLAAGILSGALSMNAGSSVQQFRGLTYGMMGAGMMGGGGSGQGAGGGGATAAKAASDVAVASAGGNLDTGQPVSKFAQPVSKLATAYLTSDQSKVPVTAGTNTQSSQGAATDGGSAGGVTVAGDGGSNTTTKASGITNRAGLSQQLSPLSNNEVATTEEK